MVLQSITPAAASSICSFDLAGRTALVTGASSGFGRRFAAVLAKAGARVAVTARNVERLNIASHEFSGPGGEPVLLTMDVRDRATIGLAINGALDALGKIDVLVNNAGVSIRRGALEHTEDDWDAVIETNLVGAWFVAQKTARTMADRGGGSIINVASIFGSHGGNRIASYVTSKHGLIGLTRALAIDLAPYGIRVNALAPGFFVTDMTAGLLASSTGNAIKSRVPMGRFGDLSDLDGPLLLLASDAGRYLTGAVIPVDGGHSAGV